LLSINQIRFDNFEVICRAGCPQNHAGSPLMQLTGGKKRAAAATDAMRDGTERITEEIIDG
jgi:hypothetical protein